MIRVRPLPCSIVVMTLLVSVKTAGLINAFTISSPAHATTREADESKGAHGAAATKEPAKERASGKEGAAPAPAAPTAATPPQPPADPPISDAEKAALQDLRARRKELDARAAKLDEREALLTAAERRLTDRVQQLTTLQAKLEQLEKDRQERQEANWRGLVRTYEDMRPRDAAAIFNDLDSAVLIPVLDRMKDAKAAPILAAMIPERARAATAQLAKFRTQSNAPPKLDTADAAKP